MLCFCCMRLLLLVSVQSVYRSSYAHPKPLSTLCSHPFNLGLSPHGSRVTAAGVPTATRIPSRPSAISVGCVAQWGEEGCWEGEWRKDMSGTGYTALYLIRDQDSRAQLRAGDLSKWGSMVWAAVSGIRAQQEVFCFILSDRRHYSQQLTVALLV